MQHMHLEIQHLYQSPRLQIVLGGGRKVTVAAISDGSITGTGTATHYAIVDSTNSRLLATAALTASQSVTNGNTFTLATFDIGIPDPA